MDHEDFDADAEEPHSSTPRLPLINPGYDTPDSDYNYEVAKHQNKASHEEKENFIAVLHEPEPLTDASSVIASSESGDSYGKASQLTGSIKKSGDYISYGHNERAPRKASVPKVKYNDKYSGSYADSEISESQVSSKSYKSSGLNDSQHSVKDNKTKPQRSVRLQSTPENKRVSIRETQRKEVRRTSKAGQSLSSPVKRCDKHDNVIRSCTYAEGFGSNKTALSFPMVEQNKRESKSANELGLVFDQCLSTPAVSLRGSAKSKGDRTEEYYSLGSPCKLSLVDSCSVTRRSTPDKRNKHKNAWSAARMSPQLYQDIKERLLKEGKFKEELRKYWGLDIQEKINRPNSDDDGYDTDLETNLGLELIADEKSREVIEDGIYPEYKQNCRRFKSTPNSYFMRYSLEDNLRMRYRYLNKGDSIAMSTQMKNHLTMSDIDLKDNAIGAEGMNFFKHMLKENKRLTELNLASNNLGPEGARYLKHALRSNCFLLKLNVANNNFGEKGSRHCAALLEWQRSGSQYQPLLCPRDYIENVSLQEVNMSGNAIGDYGATLISKALEENVCLKLVDLSWNYIGRRGGVKLCDCLKKNTELEIFRAHTNGFGDEGGKMLINSLKVNHVLKEVDLSNNRLTDAFIKTFTFNLNEMQGITVLKIARNNFQPKPIFDFLAAIMTAETAITHIDIEGIHITEEFKGIANAVKVVQDVSVVYDDPPSKREYATDILHRNLVVLCEFLEDQELEVEDLYPDYEEIEEEGGHIPMVTVGEVISCLEQSGKVTRQDKIQRLKSKLKLCSKRRFHISELAVVYDGVICGKDVLRDKPLRSHLRKSIREERAEKERLAKRRTRASQIPSRVAKTAEPPSEDI